MQDLTNKLQGVLDVYKRIEGKDDIFAAANVSAEAFKKQIEDTTKLLNNFAKATERLIKVNTDGRFGEKSRETAQKEVNAIQEQVKASLGYTNSIKEALVSSEKKVKTEEKSAKELEKQKQKEEEIARKKQETVEQEQKKNEELEKQLEHMKKMQMLDTASSAIDKLQSGITGLISKITHGLGSAFGFLLTNVLGLKAGFNFQEILKEGNAVIENANLMAVSFDAVTDEYGKINMAASTYYKKALDFQNQLHDKMQLAIADLSQTQATFNYMFSNQGVDQELSTWMSKNLTGMSQDLASLYNKEFTEQARAIQSGLTGMTKSLRLEGIDISNASLQGTLDRYGIDATASSLNYANKELLRYITLWDQTNKAQGDFSRTSNASANQLKMLQNQLAQTGAMIGMIFAQAFMKVSAYIRAIVMVIQNFVRIIGNLFGVDWNMTGIESAIGSYEGLSDAVDDVGSSLGGAGKKAKEFKKQLMGFDEINNITPPTQSAGGGGAGLGGGVDISDKLIPLLKEWDTHMENIKDKAQEYADNIMNALGFTKKLNGEWEWNWQNVSPTLKKIGAAIAVVAGAVATFVAKLGLLKAAIKVVKLVDWAKDVPWIASAFTSLKTALGNIPSLLSSFKAALAGSGTTIAAIAVSLLDVVIVIHGIIDSWDEWQNRWSRAGSGLEKFGDSVAILFENMGENIATFMDDVFTNLKLDPLAEAIEVSTGIQSKAVRDATKAMTEDYKKFNKELDNTLDKYDRQVLSLQTTQVETDGYLRALDQVIDADGKVKKGKEDLADTILNKLSKATGEQYERDGDQIKINGKVVESTNDVKNSVKELIEEQKKEIETQKLQARYTALLEKQEKIHADMLELEVEKMANGNKLSKEKEAKLQSLKEEYRLFTNEVKDANDDLTLNTAINAGLINEEVVNSLHNMTDNAEQTSQLLTDNINNQYDVWLETYKNLRGETDYETSYLKQKMLELSTDTDNLTENVVKAWNHASTESSTEFINALSSLKGNNAAKILEIIDITNDNAPVVAEAYAHLGLEGTEAFKEKIENLKPNTRTAILNAYAAANPDKGEGSDFVAQMAWLAYKGTEGFDAWLDDPKNGLDASTKQAITDAKNELYANGGQFKEGGKYDGKKVVEGYKENKVDAASVIEQNEQSAKDKGKWLRGLIIAGIGSITLSIGGVVFAGGVLWSLREKLRKYFETGEYASGGFPTKGQFFVAREAGPELVGTIGNRTAVANNAQIVAAVSAGVARAVSSVLASGGFTMILPDLQQSSFGADPQAAANIANAVIEGLREEPLRADVDIHAHTDKSVIFEEAANGIQEYTNRTGELPFSIPI